MGSPFARALGRLHRVISERLADAQGDHLSRAGQPLVTDVNLIIDRQAERYNEVTGGLDRVTVINVYHSDLPTLDRQGSFLVNGQTLHIDGIESDDGHMVGFYVRP